MERGQIGLDDDISTVMTEFKDVQILTGFDEETQTPNYKKSENKITLRYISRTPRQSGYRYLLGSSLRIARALDTSTMIHS